MINFIVLALLFIVFTLFAACTDYEVVLFGGQVGVCINNTYGIICDHFWDELDAQVVCRQLNLDNSGHAIPLTGTYFENGTVLDVIAFSTNVRCTGNETFINDCAMILNTNCDLSQVAGVICQHQGTSTFLVLLYYYISIITACV